MTRQPPQPVKITAKELARRREALGLTQSELAAALGMGRRQIQRFEAGQWPAPALVVLAIEALEGRAK